MRRLPIAALTVLMVLLLAIVPARAFADEASPEQPLEEAVVEDVEEPLEAAADEAGPLEANSGGTVSVYRLFNRRTSEHLYTTSRSEYESLPRKTHGDWVWEGVAWVAPKKSSTPVYRLYNKGLGDHHYTTSKGERDALTRKGWRYEGVAFYSDDSHRVPLYRLYNGRLKAGQHHYTTSKGERDSLVKKSGWRSEGVGWYGISGGHAEDLSRYKFGTPAGGAIPLENLIVSDRNMLAYMLFRLESLGYLSPGDYVYIVQDDSKTLSVTPSVWSDGISTGASTYSIDRRTVRITRSYRYANYPGPGYSYTTEVIDG